MGNNCIAAMPADGKAVRIRLPTSIHKRAARRSCMPLKNAAVSGASRAPLASRARPCPVGSKKSSSASSFTYHFGRPRPRGSHFHYPGTGRILVVCAQKSARLLDLDRPVPQDTTGGGLCRWGSEQKDVPAVVGGHSAGVSPGPVLHRLFESLCLCHPGEAAHGGGKRDRRNRPCRALE
jgi:hypothetical protein